ncbi:MAG: hypothetical protein KBD37_07605, partial [Burkholderiales bacterium]|nr:hypothetical protein [Burkholderiales bacterium]
MPGISVIGGGSSYKVVSENKHPLFANSPRSKLFWHAIDYIKNFNIDLNNAILKTDKLGKEIIGWEATTCQAFRALDEHSIAGWFGGKHLSKEQTVLLAVCYFLGHISSSIDSAASCEVVQEEALRKWIGGLKDGVVNINIDSSYLSEVKVAPNNDIVIVDQPYPLISWKKLQSYATAYADKYPLKRIHFKTIIDNKSLYDNSDTQSGPRCISLGRIFLLDLMLKSTTVLFRKPIKNAYINLLTISPSGSLSEEAVKRSNELLYPDNKEFSNRFQAIQDICATNSRELDQITLAHALLFSVVLMKKSSLPQLYIE